MGAREKGKLVAPTVKRESSSGPNGKREKGKGRPAAVEIQFHCATRSRVHARTKCNDFHVEHPPTSDIHIYSELRYVEKERYLGTLVHEPV